MHQDLGTCYCVFISCCLLTVETGWLFPMAPLQDLEKDALSQDASMS